MLTRMKKFTAIAAALLFALPAVARVTPVNEYNNKIDTSADEESYTCASYSNYYDEPQYNAKCTQRKLTNGAKCYECYCDSNTYQFTASQCNSTGFTPDDSARCTVGTTTTYSNCNCASGYLSSNEFVDTVAMNFSYNGTPASIIGSSGKNLTCYQPKNFSCLTGSKLTPEMLSSITGTSTSAQLITKSNYDSPYLTYTARSTLKTISDSNTIFCTKGVTPTGPLFSTRPNSNDCAEYVTDTAKYYNNQTYGYFNGNCSTNGQCLGTGNANDCVLSSSPTVTTYIPGTYSTGSVSCRMSSGCDVGVVTKDDGTQYMCAGEASSTPVNGVYFDYTDISAGTATCRKINGCASPYEVANLYYGQTDQTDDMYMTDSTTHYTYEVQTLTVENSSATSSSVEPPYKATIKCRTPNGCRTDQGYYDITCPTGCWNGLLSWWAGAVPSTPATTIEEVTSETWAAKVASNKCPVLVIFNADWCGPCKMLLANSDVQALNGVDNVKIYQLNVDENQSIADSYSVTSLPTSILFKGGNRVATVNSGSATEIQTAIANNKGCLTDNNMTKFVCTTCGYVAEGHNAPVNCPVCNGTSFDPMESDIFANCTMGDSLAGTNLTDGVLACQSFNTSAPLMYLTNDGSSKALIFTIASAVASVNQISSFTDGEEIMAFGETYCSNADHIMTPMSYIAPNDSMIKFAATLLPSNEVCIFGAEGVYARILTDSDGLGELDQVYTADYYNKVDCPYSMIPCSQTVDFSQ